MSEELASLLRQLKDSKENLRLIQERKAEFVQGEEIPLQLVRDERLLRKQIEQFNLRIDKLRQIERIPVVENIPTLLPYLADCSEQEFRLEEALKSISSGYPLIVVVYGDEFQCHDKFLERMQYRSLPCLLRLDAKNQAIKAYPLDWPARLKDLSELSRRLHVELSNTVLHHALGSLIEIQQMLASHPGPVLFHTHLLSNDWKQHGSKLLEHYLRFWQTWQELDGQQHLLVFLFIKFQVSYNKSPLPFTKSLNEVITIQLKNLDISGYAPLHGVVLPCLEGVTRTEAEDWARSPEVSALVDPELLIKEIRDFYNREAKGQSGQISMEKLVDRLSLILKKYIT